uniref:Uncharacterized protein n=1 Tax=Cacopsylla melanoneura TaxID=428564 RepID=A0A8D8UYR5_9HEMI
MSQDTLVLHQMCPTYCIIDVLDLLICSCFISGPILAFAQTIHMSASFLSPMVAGYFLQDDETSLETWRRVFLIAGAVGSCTYLSYQLFGTAEVQPWNQLPPKAGSPGKKLPEQKPFICEEGRRASIVKSNGTATSYETENNI